MPDRERQKIKLALSIADNMHTHSIKLMLSYSATEHEAEVVEKPCYQQIHIASGRCEVVQRVVGALE